MSGTGIQFQHKRHKSGRTRQPVKRLVLSKLTVFQHETKLFTLHVSTWDSEVSLVEFNPFLCQSDLTHWVRTARTLIILHDRSEENKDATLDSVFEVRNLFTKNF